MNTKNRLRIFIKNLELRRLDAFLVTGEPNVSYLSGYTGTESLLLFIKGKRYFLTDFRYAEQAQKECPDFEVALRDGGSYAQMIEGICSSNGVRRLGIEPARMSLQFYKALSKVMTRAVLLPCPDLIESQRIVKEKNEITRIKQSINHAYNGMLDLAATIRPGIKERDVQARLEYQTKLSGSEKPAFDMIIAAGANSSMPHAVSGLNKLERNNILLVDMGCVHLGYHSDLTRCFFTGRISPLQRKVYNIVLKAQELGIKAVKPGVKASDVDRACRNYIEKQGYGKYFGHGTGHGVGLEIHEAPNISFRSKEVLEEGMIITVEPGIYLPSKFGVRIEDMLLVGGNKGHDVITQKVVKTRLN